MLGWLHVARTAVRLPLLGLVSTTVWATAAASPGLDAVAWPETRGDGLRSGRTCEEPLSVPVVRWTTSEQGAAARGEPVVTACSLVLAEDDGAIVARELRAGSEVWRVERSYAVMPASVTSALAVGAAGRLFVGLPGDGGISLAWKSRDVLQDAIQAYWGDLRQLPPGPDLASTLVPKYLAAIPENPLAGRPMVGAPTPAPGDYVYRTDGDFLNLGIWWTDGKVVPDLDACSGFSPPLPLSTESGGELRSLVRTDGRMLWRRLDNLPAINVFPAVIESGILWTANELTGVASSPIRGGLLLTDINGLTVGERRTSSAFRGAAAVDLSSGAMYAAHGSSANASWINSVASALGSAIEGYASDVGFYPPSGDLASYIVPSQIACMPQHPLGGRRIAWRPSVSPGDYDYTSTSSRYRVLIWGEEGQPAAVFEDGSLVLSAIDRPPGVLAVDPLLRTMWRRALVSIGEDVTPLVLRADSTIVVGTSTGLLYALDAATGATVWQRDLGSPLIQSPALLASGGILAISVDGRLNVVAPDGDILMSRATGTAPGGSATIAGDDVIYVPGSDGRLRAYSRDLAILWTVDLSDGRLSLTTAPVQADGLLVVGRSDGSWVVLADADWSDIPNDLGNSLRAWRAGRDVVFVSVGPPSACAYNIRASSDPEVRSVDPLISRTPPGMARDPDGVRRVPAIIYYRVYGVGCCSGTQGPG